jgi:hypothetical protein
MAGPRPTFQPRFTLSVLYVFAVFFVYCLLLIAPELYEVWRSMPPGPEQQEAAQRAAQEAIASRLWLAFLAAVVTILLAARANLLPGMRRRP